MHGTGMPEAAVDKHGKFQAREDDVGASANTGHRGEVNPVSQPTSSSDRTASSGPVSRDRLACIFRRRPGDDAHDSVALITTETTQENLVAPIVGGERLAVGAARLVADARFHRGNLSDSPVNTRDPVVLRSSRTRRQVMTSAKGSRVQIPLVRRSTVP